jgi:hypothetical protein
MTGVAKSYRLAEYEITERYGEIWWKAHAGFGTTRAGKCGADPGRAFVGLGKAIDEYGPHRPE